MITGYNLRLSVQSAVDRWAAPVYPVPLPPVPPEDYPPPRPQDPTVVPLADGIVVGDQTVSSLTLRALVDEDAILIREMQTDYAGVMHLVESLTGVPFADLSTLTQRDFDVTAMAVFGHLQAYNDSLKKAWRNHGRPPALVLP